MYSRQSQFLFRLRWLLVTLLLLSVLASAKHVKRSPPLDRGLQSSPAQNHYANAFFKLARRWDTDRGELQKRDMECRRVHEFDDKCKFIRENCADEEVGFFNYLELYYCRLPNVPAVPFTVMATWLVMLFTTIGIAASDFFCINLSTIANILGMSESMAGVTFLAFGNGSPDVFSTFAAMKINSGSLAVGELIGAASFIAAVVAGSMAIVHPFRVGRKSFVRDVSFFIVAVLFGIGFLADGQIQMWECAVMVVFYVFYVCFVVVWHWMEKSRKQRRRKERMSREHYTAPEEEDLLIEEDDEDGGVSIGETDALLAGGVHDFGALERAEDDADDVDEEEEEQQVYADLSNAMRISRPRMERSMTLTTPHGIRPSLVGALEFRAVLHHLEKTGNLQGRPIHLRRYSDDPFHSISIAYSAPGALINYSLSTTLPQEPNPRTGRLRAVSASDAAHANFDWSQLQSKQTNPDINLTLASPRESSHLDVPFRAPTFDLLALPTPHTRSHPPSISSEPTSPLTGTSHLTALDSGSDTSSLRVFESPRVLSPRSGSPLPTVRLPSPPNNVSPHSPRWSTVKYWPYSYLPPPQLLSATLFPTLHGWADKTWGEKALGLVAVLPVFLLTISLPVVETDPHATDTPVVVLPETEVPGVGPKEWNRWLVCVQCLTAPVFMMMMFVYDPESPRSVVKPVLYSLVVGLSCLGGLLAATSPKHAPRWRWALCFAGFAVSIGWISGVANEVVGVLKAFGVIFGISDAILGLTIFAVGNSLGDLVADITVARLGFPVMALSACFGGPMLNILLGIGISGLYITLSRTDHRAYQIEVSSTLIISAATLLITLALLLVAVPLNKWTMSRRIGWTLIALWVVSTVVNLGVELMGVGGTWRGDAASG